MTEGKRRVGIVRESNLVICGVVGERDYLEEEEDFEGAGEDELPAP